MAACSPGKVYSSVVTSSGGAWVQTIVTRLQVFENNVPKHPKYEASSNKRSLINIVGHFGLGSFSCAPLQ